MVCRGAEAVVRLHKLHSIECRIRSTRMRIRMGSRKERASAFETSRSTLLAFPDLLVLTFALALVAILAFEVDYIA